MFAFFHTGTRLSFAHFRITLTMFSTWKTNVFLNIWTAKWYSEWAWNSNTEYLKPHCSVSSGQGWEYTKLQRGQKKIDCWPAMYPAWKTSTLIWIISHISSQLGSVPCQRQILSLIRALITRLYLRPCIKSLSVSVFAAYQRKQICLLEIDSCAILIYTPHTRYAQINILQYLYIHSIPQSVIAL